MIYIIIYFTLVVLVFFTVYTVLAYKARRKKHSKERFTQEFCDADLGWLSLGSLAFPLTIPAVLTIFVLICIAKKINNILWKIK